MSFCVQSLRRFGNASKTQTIRSGLFLVLDRSPIPGWVEEDHPNVGLATDFVVQVQLIYAEPSQRFDALVSVIEQHTPGMEMPLIPEAELECLTAYLKAIPSTSARFSGPPGDRVACSERN